jgi:hypothetical protein
LPLIFFIHDLFNGAFDYSVYVTLNGRKIAVSVIRKLVEGNSSDNLRYCLKIFLEW